LAAAAGMVVGEGMTLLQTLFLLAMPVPIARASTMNWGELAWRGIKSGRPRLKISPPMKSQQIELGGEG
jgi:hypothetical protein